MKGYRMRYAEGTYRNGPYADTGYPAMIAFHADHSERKRLPQRNMVCITEGRRGRSPSSFRRPLNDARALRQAIYTHRAEMDTGHGSLPRAQRYASHRETEIEPGDTRLYRRPAPHRVDRGTFFQPDNRMPAKRTVLEEQRSPPPQAPLPQYGAAVAASSA